MVTCSSYGKRPGWAAFAHLVGCVVYACAAFVSTSPVIAAVTTIVGNGQPSNRVDMVFVGDGYTQADLNAGKYTSHIANYVDYMFGATPGYLADPFPRYHKFFNVHAVAVASQDSGADYPPHGVFRNTALDATYWTAGVQHSLSLNNSKASFIVDSNLAGTGISADIRFATVNDTLYGGSGGFLATFAGGNVQARELALHELSHSFSNTLDEYVVYQANYPSPEPTAANVTIDPTGSKWERWLGFQDPRSDDLDIGVFTGAAYYSGNVYRPTLDSKMRTLGRPYNAIVREKAILDIYDYVDPLDDWRSNGTPISDGALWVQVVDPAVIQVDWYVDDELVVSDAGSEFDLQDFNFPSGSYTVRSLAYDRVINHVGDGSLLDLVRKDLHKLQQSIEWTVDFTAANAMPGDYNSNGVVDANDYLVWRTNFGSTINLSADGDGNGRVDTSDYTIWRDNLPTMPAGTVAATTPEPTALLQLLAVVVAATGLRSRRVPSGSIPRN
jgi:hypothetical protein